MIWPSYNSKWHYNRSLTSGKSSSHDMDVCCRQAVDLKHTDSLKNSTTPAHVVQSMLFVHATRMCTISDTILNLTCIPNAVGTLSWCVWLLQVIVCSHVQWHSCHGHYICCKTATKTEFVLSVVLMCLTASSHCLQSCSMALVSWTLYLLQNSHQDRIRIECCTSYSDMIYIVMSSMVFCSQNPFRKSQLHLIVCLV